MKLKVTFHRNTKSATERMMAFAEYISETLDIPMPKDEGFDTIHEFIDKHLKEFQVATSDLEAEHTFFMTAWAQEQWDDDLPF